MDSKNRKQLELLTGRDQPHVEDVTPQLVRLIKNKPTFLSAWNFGVQFSELEDKQVYGPLKIDGSHWSKIEKGTASPPADERFERYFDVVQNEFPLIWLCERRGYDFMSLRRHRTTMEKQLEEKDAEIAAHKRTIKLLMEARS